MAGQEQATGERANRSAEEYEEIAKGAGATATEATMTELGQSIDEILATIDDVLEADAEVFVANFKQLNGE